MEQNLQNTEKVVLTGMVANWAETLISIGWWISKEDNLIREVTESCFKNSYLTGACHMTKWSLMVTRVGKEHKVINCCMVYKSLKRGLRSPIQRCAILRNDSSYQSPHSDMGQFWS